MSVYQAQLSMSRVGACDLNILEAQNGRFAEAQRPLFPTPAAAPAVLAPQQPPPPPAAPSRR
eukprot:7234019-Lingulodinium_polyedra.AAC.1